MFCHCVCCSAGVVPTIGAGAGSGVAGAGAGAGGGEGSGTAGEGPTSGACWGTLSGAGGRAGSGTPEGPAVGSARVPYPGARPGIDGTIWVVAVIWSQDTDGMIRLMVFTDLILFTALFFLLLTTRTVTRRSRRRTAIRAQRGHISDSNGLKVSWLAGSPASGG